MAIQEKLVPGFQGSKDRLTLARPNIADDLKLETVPTDHSINPRPLKIMLNVFCLCSINETTKAMCYLFKT